MNSYIFSFLHTGCGIPAACRRAVATAHCTSKITTFEDIFKPNSFYGFRGEALHSIAAASATLSIISRCSNESSGESVVFRKGVQASISPCAATPGTIIKVEGLFALFPVRLKQVVRGCEFHSIFIHTVLLQLQKRLTQEFSKIKRLLIAYALARPSLRIVSTRPMLRKNACSGVGESIAALYSATFLESLVHVDFTTTLASQGVEIYVNGFYPSRDCKPANPHNLYKVLSPPRLRSQHLGRDPQPPQRQFVCVSQPTALSPPQSRESPARLLQALAKPTRA
jgi:DNA mismatch repair ATPase MutL